MKQVIVTISLLAVGLALVISTVVPLMRHGTGIGNKAIDEGRSIIPKISDVMK